MTTGWVYTELQALLPDVPAPRRRPRRFRKSGVSAPQADAAMLRLLTKSERKRLDEQPEFRRRSSQMYSLIRLLIQNGREHDFIVRVLGHHAPTIEKWGDSYDDDAWRIIDKLNEEHDHEGLSCFDARCHAFMDERRGHVEVLASVRWLHATNTSGGIAGTTDCKVLDAILLRSLQTGKLAFGYSHRQLAIDAAVDRKTAAASLERLSEIVRYERPLVCGDGGTVTILHDTVGPLISQGATTPHLLWLYEPSGGTLSPSHDIQRWKGVNTGPMRTYEVLDYMGSSSLLDLADQLRSSRRTVERHLARLALYGLAVRLSDGSWEAQHRDPDIVAKEAGTAGMKDEATERFRRERKNFERAMGLGEPMWDGMPIPRLMDVRSRDEKGAPPPL